MSDNELDEPAEKPTRRTWQELKEEGATFASAARNHEDECSGLSTRLAMIATRYANRGKTER